MAENMKKPPVMMKKAMKYNKYSGRSFSSGWVVLPYRAIPITIRNDVMESTPKKRPGC
jgi:hypothetical protein